MVRHVQVVEHGAVLFDAIRFGRDLHVGRHHPSATGLQTTLPRDLDQANATCSHRCKAIVMAERRDFDIGPVSDLKNGLAGKRFDGLAVEFD